MGIVSYIVWILINIVFLYINYSAIDEYKNNPKLIKVKYLPHVGIICFAISILAILYSFFKCLF